MNVPTMAEMLSQGKSPEVLFWVGAAGSYDDRAKKITRAFVKLLHKANVDFAVLGTEESSTGDAAKRAGNEFLFQMQAISNIEILNSYEVKTIVCTDPHSFNTLKNEYPELGGDYDVIHHTEFLNELLEDGKLLSKKSHIKITYHDSCYLGRGNKIYEAPRNLINLLSENLHEMKRSKENGLCCGAGGSQIFKESESGNVEINLERIKDIEDINPDTVAVACPFCMTMINDGVNEKNLDKKINVKDISEIIEENLKK